MTLPDYIYTLYNELLKEGWRLREIDDMDMLGFLKLRAYALKKEKEPKKKHIDEIWPTYYT